MTAARIRALLPEMSFRAAWSSAAFLFYAGTAVMVVAIVWLLAELNGSGDDFGFVGWSTLGLAALIVTAVFLTSLGMDVLAGLAAFVGLIVFAVWLGALEDWIGLFPDDTESFFNNDFEIGFLILEVLVIAAGILAMRRWRFALLTLVVAAFFWYGFVDNFSRIVGSDTDKTHDWLSIIAGLLLLATGIWLDRSGRAAYALWLHIVGGVTVGGGILDLVQGGSNGWWWVAALIALAYVAAARGLARSSYAVIGAIGVVWVGGHFIEDWYHTPNFPFFFVFGEEGGSTTWKGPASYVVLGLILVVLGLLVDRGLRARDRGAAPTTP